MAQESLLLVENERVVRTAITRWLTEANYHVDNVASGEEALVRLSQRDYDLLLVDLNMPKMDGRQLLREARKSHSQAAALVLTGYGSMNRVIECMDAGAQGFIIKPFYPDQLLQSVRDALARQSLARERHRQDAFKPIIELSRGLLSNEDLAGFGQAFMRKILEATGADQAALFILNHGRLELLCAEGFDGAPQAPGRSQVEHMEGLLRGEGQSIISMEGGAFSWPDLRPIGHEPTYKLCVPLHLLGVVTGLVLVGRRDGTRGFSESDVELLWISCAIASGVVERLRSVSSKITSG